MSCLMIRLYGPCMFVYFFSHLLFQSTSSAFTPEFA
ncbi:hypothetical protein V3C99_008035 [Haemonchus contortus]